MLANFYAAQIRRYTQELLSIENGRTGLPFFSKDCVELLDNKISPDSFVYSVYIISDDTDFYSTLRQHLGGHTKKIDMRLGFIERPWRAANLFTEVAERVGSFSRTNFQLLPGYSSRKVQPPKTLPWTPKPSLTPRLSRELAKVKWVHAEINILSKLLSDHSESSDLVPYLGVSKKTCYQCGHFIRSIDRFRTRENHSKVYSQWTLPRSLRVSTADAERFCKATQILEDTLILELSRDDRPSKDAEKESVLARATSCTTTTSTSLTYHVKDPLLLERKAEFWSSESARVMEYRYVTCIVTREPEYSTAVLADHVLLMLVVSSKTTRLRPKTAFLWVSCRRNRITTRMNAAHSMSAT